MVKSVIENQPVRAIYSFSDEPHKMPSENQTKRISARSHIWRPSTDVLETEDAVIVRVEIAGMRDGEFSITLDEQTLSIKGTRSGTSECKAYHQMEIPFGDFSTEVVIPLPIDSIRIEAVYLDGFLRIWLPKIKPHQVPIEVE